MKGIYGLLCLVLLSCATTKNSVDKSLTGDWELVLFPNADKSFAELFGERKPELTFSDTTNAVSGTTGCNRLRTAYATKGNKFSFDKNIITTRMACPGYDETAFLNALTKVNRYQLQSGQLQLLQDSLLVMAFAKR